MIHFFGRNVFLFGMKFIRMGWVEEVSGVNCQESTYDELIETLKVTLKEAVEYNRKDAIHSAGQNYREEKIAV